MPWTGAGLHVMQDQISKGREPTAVCGERREQSLNFRFGFIVRLLPCQTTRLFALKDECAGSIGAPDYDSACIQFQLLPVQYVQ